MANHPMNPQSGDLVTLDRAHFISFMLGGGKLRVEAEDGWHIIERLDAAYYVVDGESQHTLEGIYTWFGFYHVDFAAAIVNGYVI